MDGLLIEFNGNTGERAGNISPRDPKLRCFGWQDLESSPAKEVRIIEDDRDVTQFENVPGVTVLKGKVEIEAAIANICGPRYIVQNETLLREHLQQKNINLSDYEGKDTAEILKILYETEKIIGIKKFLPRELPPERIVG